MGGTLHFSDWDGRSVRDVALMTCETPRRSCILCEAAVMDTFSFLERRLVGS